MNSGFNASALVTDPEYLFGHNTAGALLDQLILQMQMGVNSQLLGEHRSGKTSVMRCCSAQLLAQHSRLVPVYINFRQHHYVRGRAAALRFLLANIHASVIAHHPEFARETTVRDLNLSASPHPETHYSTLETIKESYRVDSLLEEYVLKILPDRELGLVLMFDEYEHMMLETFEGQTGAFFLIRDLASEPPAKGLPKPCTYVLAGAVPWNRMCAVVGSPELNNIAPVYYVSPISIVDFTQMWEHCVRESAERVRLNITNSGWHIDDIYKLTGGWPFYAKVIGDYLSTGVYQRPIFYESLLQHFNVIWSHLDSSERTLLKDVAGQNDVTINGHEIIKRGLLEINFQGEPEIRGQLWADYVIEQPVENIDHARTGKVEILSIPKEKLKVTIETVMSLIYEINEANRLMNGGSLVFLLSNQDWKNYQQLLRLSLSEDGFSHFAQSMYNLLFERTTDVRDGRSRPLEKLPVDFRRKRTIVRVIDSIRHHYGGHNTELPTFNIGKGAMPIEDVLNRYLGSKAPPKDSQFLDLQFSILNDMVTYLNKLLTFIRHPDPAAE